MAEGRDFDRSDLRSRKKSQLKQLLQWGMSDQEFYKETIYHPIP